ncbi:MAG: hypothetical protein ACI4BB_09070, partial [Coprococcus sp.]
LMLLLSAIMFSGDKRILWFHEISLGYAADGGIAIMEWSTHRGLGGENIAIKEYVYNKEELMLRDLSSSIIDIAFLENEGLLFDNKITDIRIILEFRLEDHTNIAVCVKEKMLEDNLDILLHFTNILGLKDAEIDAYRLLMPDEWIELYRKMGYEDEQIMEYLILDFQMEALWQ